MLCHHREVSADDEEVAQLVAFVEFCCCGVDLGEGLGVGDAPLPHELVESDITKRRDLFEVLDFDGGQFAKLWEQSVVAVADRLQHTLRGVDSGLLKFDGEPRVPISARSAALMVSSSAPPRMSLRRASVSGFVGRPP